MKKVQIVLPLSETEGQESELLDVGTPLPMQYLGSKTRIAASIIKAIKLHLPQTNNFVDLFAGTGCVAVNASKHGFRTWGNDLQPYSFAILKSLFETPRTGLSKLRQKVRALDNEKYLLKGARGENLSLLRTEDDLFKKLESSIKHWREYRDFCEGTKLVEGKLDEVLKLRTKNSWNLFSKYYINAYFGVRQSLQLDLIRELSEELSGNEKFHLIAATISAMTYAVSSTTHLAQYIKPNNPRAVKALLARRKCDLIDAILHRLHLLEETDFDKRNKGVFNLDFKEALGKIKLNPETVVYVDPPYFKEHYSRYYHVLDTFYYYDYPELTHNPRLNATTVGRYRKDRLISDFGLRAYAKKAFVQLLEATRFSKACLAISYANTSLVSKSDLLKLFSHYDYDCKMEQFKLLHSGQGRERNHYVIEYLFLLTPKGKR